MATRRRHTNKYHKYIKNYTPGGAARRVAYHQREGRIVVLARGVFDLGPHEGHLDFLKRARDLGTILIVNVNNDAWVRMHKREPIMTEVERPIMTEVERARRLALENIVDYVFVHPAYDIHPALALAIDTKPNIIVREDKSKENKDDSLIIEEEKRILMERLGYVPDYRILPRSPVEISTTELLRRIKERVGTPKKTIVSLDIYGHKIIDIRKKEDTNSETPVKK